jgi:FMN phosphatase YigB (HAD superfamily)
MDTTQINYNKFDNFISQYDLYAFDFDQTILKIHAYAMDIKATQVEAMSWKKLMDHFADPIFFRDLINYLISKKKKVAIVSFGTYNVIKAYLDRLFDNPNIFTQNNILTPLEGNQRYNRTLKPDSDKNQLLIDLSRKDDIEYNRILFFDDDIKNIERAKEMGVEAIHIIKPNGFNKDLWQQLVAKSIPSTTSSATLSSLSSSITSRNNSDYPLEQTTNKIPPLPSSRGGSIEKFENPKPDVDEEKVKQVKVNKKVKKEKEEKEPENEEEGGFMSYYMNWINVLAIIFIAIYWIIEKFT